MLEIVATIDRSDLIDNEAGRIRQLAARHGDEIGIWKPVSPADADIDHLAFPDVEHLIISTGHVVERIEEAQLAQHLQLTAAYFFDPKLVRMDRALVDESDTMPCPREHGRRERARKAAADDRDVDDDRRGRRSSARLGHVAIRRHGPGSQGQRWLAVQFSRLSSHRRTKRDHFSISRLTQRRPARPDEIRHAPCSGWPFPPSRSAFQWLISPHRPSMRRSAATRPGRTLLYLGQWGQRCSIVE